MSASLRSSCSPEEYGSGIRTKQLTHPHLEEPLKGLSGNEGVETSIVEAEGAENVGQRS